MTTSESNIDIKENSLLKLDAELLQILLQDKSSKKNIIWATDNYIKHGEKYNSECEITINLITGKNGSIIKPRTEKSKAEQQSRIRDKAEVFTPSWICNEQNNLVDESWFGKKNVFNIQKEKSWKATSEKIKFSDTDKKTWKDYVSSRRMEITC